MLLLASAFTVLFTVQLLPAMVASVEVEKVIVSGEEGGGNATTQIRTERFVVKRDVDADELLKNCRVSINGTTREGHACWTAVWSTTRVSTVPSELAGKVSVGFTPARKSFKMPFCNHSTTEYRWTTNVYVV